MKRIYLFGIVLFSALCIGQSTPVIKIYLEDAESGNNIKGAKVTLEGFELPEIVGKYDKKGRFYYFTKIPAGYNTVMAYHKKYNEKGFQDVDGLPKEVRLRLYDPLNVSYSFEKSDKSHFQNFYVEDPYKFAITSNSDGDYNVFRLYLLSELEKLNLEIELVNPYLEMEKNLKIPKKLRGRLPYFEENQVSHQNNDAIKQKEAYPDIVTFPLLNFEEFILPLINYNSTYDKVIDNGGEPLIQLDSETKVVFYLRKKNSKKFKRYNDPILKKINEIKNIKTYSVLYNKCQLEFKNGDYNKNNYSRALDKFNKIKDIDSSKIFFYSKIREFKYKKRILNNFFSVRCKLKLGKPDLKLEFHDFNFLQSLEKKYETSSKLIAILKNSKIIKFDNAIGLGMLDQLERIGDSLQLGSD